MKFIDYFESPLPEYVDKNKINYVSSGFLEFQKNRKLYIKKLIKKIGENSKKKETLKFLKNNLQMGGMLGEGSTRKVFPGNKNTVIKIAYTDWGLEQNSEEVKFTNSIDKKFNNFFVNIIDQDKDSNIFKNLKIPLWIEVEKAQKINDHDIKRYFDIEYEELTNIIHRVHYAKNNNTLIKSFKSKEEKVFLQKFLNSKYGSHLLEFLWHLKNLGIYIEDIARKSQWGKFNDHFVILDLGFKS